MADILDQWAKEIDAEDRVASGFSGDGLISPGNINLSNRTPVKNSDGTISTVRSISIGTDNGEVLIPTVVGGKVVSDDDAIKHYRETGENLGTFSSPQSADNYAEFLHKSQERQYAHQKGDLLSQWAAEIDAQEEGPKISAIPTFAERLSQGDIAGALSIPYRAIRNSEAVTRALGPSRETLVAESIPFVADDGTVQYQYKPLADRVEREGLFTASPFVTDKTVESLGLNPSEEDSTAKSITKGIGRAGVGVVGGLSNPLSIATLGGTVASQVPVVDRALAGAFSADALAMIPEQVESLRNAKNPGEAAEAIAGLAAGVGLGGLGANYALRGAHLPVTAQALEEAELSKTTNVKQPEQEAVVSESDSATEIATPAQPEGIEVEAVTEPVSAPDVARTEAPLEQAPFSEVKEDLSPLPESGDITLYRYENSNGEPSIDPQVFEEFGEEMGAKSLEDRGRWFSSDLESIQHYNAPDKRLITLTVPASDAAKYRRGESGFVVPRELAEKARKFQAEEQISEQPSALSAEQPTQTNERQIRQDERPDVALQNEENPSRVLEEEQGRSAVRQPEEVSASENGEAAPVYGDVQRPEITEEGTREVPIRESREGVPEEEVAAPAADSKDFVDNLTSDKTRQRLEAIARAKNIPADSIPDVVQNALLKAQEAQQGNAAWNPVKGAFSTWINTIGKNAANDFLRKEIPKGQRETSLETPIGEEGTLGDVIAGETPTAYDAAEIDDYKARITDLLKDFPEGERNVITMAMQGLSNSEIAQQTGMKENAVRSLKNRGLNKLRKSPYILGISPDNKVTKWLSDNYRRLFTAEGNLPRNVFDRSIQRSGEIKEQSRETAYATRDLYNALKEEFGIGTTEKLLSGYSNIPKEFVNRMNQALLGEVPMDSLPERVRGPLQAMRDHVDALSQQMIDLGLIPDELKAVVEDGLGVYLTRSYRIFDDKKWLDKVDPELKNKAVNYVFKEKSAYDPAYTVEDARRDVDAMLQDWSEEGGGALIKRGAKLGSKDLSSFIKRKDIPKELRDVMGEYKNPVINYTRSVAKMSNFIANERFLRDVLKEGMGKFLFKDGTQPSGYNALIAAENSRVMEPLNGLRTTPQIAAAFAEFNKTDPEAKGLWKLWAQTNALAKGSKTVGSLMTQARNTLGQPYFWLLNGHWNPSALPDSGKYIFANLVGSNKEAQAAYKEYLRLGVVDQSTNASELRDVLKDAGLNDPNFDQFDKATIALDNLKKYTLGSAEQAYQLSDDIGKIVGFENELATQKKIHPDLPEEEVKQIAAQRIRNTYPTYSMVPQAVKQWRKQPFLGPFVTFAWEAYRTLGWNMRYAAEDLQSSNPAQRAAGARRAAGVLAVLAGSYGLSSLSRQLLGISPEEASDAREFQAPWDKNAQLFYTDKNPGQLGYINLSYINPYSGIADLSSPIIHGLSSGEGIDEITGQMFAKAIEPFANEGILAAKLIDVARNQTESGRQVYNPSDPNKIVPIMGHVLEALEPGTVTRLREKYIPALQGRTTIQGKKLSPAQEFLSEITGLKKQTIDFTQSLAYKSSNFREADQNAEKIFRDVALRRGTVDPEEIVQSFTESNQARFAQWKSMYRGIRAAERRGVPASEIRNTLKTTGVTDKDAKSLLRGIYEPYTPSAYFRAQLRDRKRQLPSEVFEQMNATKGLSLDGDL